MPYMLAFTKVVPITDREQYINDCCVGGDAIADLLLPAVRARYEDVGSGQEDWGWFIWFKKGAIFLAIDIHTDDPDTGQYRIGLTTRVKKLFGYKEQDTPELDELRTFVESELNRVGATNITLESE